MAKMIINSNKVDQDKFNKFKLHITEIVADALKGCYGPYGSHTLMNNGLDGSKYTKDGKEILDSLKVHGEIAHLILNELKAITNRVANTVGDSTTSVILLSNIILRNIINEEFTAPPSFVVSAINEVCELLISEIESNAQEFNSERARDIAYIASNGDSKLADNIKSLYDKYGNNITIEPKTSFNERMIKEINGTSLDFGMKYDFFANNNGECILNNPRIYYFRDPIDNADMIKAVSAIITENIAIRLKNNETRIPTLILAPGFSRDFEQEMMHMFNAFKNAHSVIYREPVCLVEYSHDLGFLKDIRNLTNGSEIGKYLTSDNKVSYEDYNYLNERAGTCKQVIIDGAKTVFKFDTESEEYKANFNNVINDLKNSIALEKSKENPKDTNINLYEKRIKRLECNIIEYHESSISNADRINKLTVLEDVCVSVANASRNGVGRAALFELLNALNKVEFSDDLQIRIKEIIGESVKELITHLIDSSGYESDPESVIQESLIQGVPFNIVTQEFDSKLVTSIMSDITILECLKDVLSKLIITNQVLVDNTQDALIYNGGL